MLPTPSSGAPLEPPELERLVKAAQQGDHEAFVTLAGALRPRLWARAFARTGEAAAAEDLLQDACLQAYRKLPTLKEPRALCAWMLAMLDRLATRENTRRAAARRLADIHAGLRADAAPADAGDPADPGHPGDDGAWAESLEDLRAAVRNLSDDEREILTLRFDAGLSAPEIADELGSTSGAIRARLCRTLQKLRNLLGALL